MQILSHDLFEGRAPATRGGELATTYLATQLALAGFEPAGDDGTWFQQVPIVEVGGRPRVHAERCRAAPTGTATTSWRSRAWKTPKVAVRGEVVFVGHGIVAPEQKWNDYAGVDVKGKWVLIMVNDPPAPADEPTLFGGPGADLLRPLDLQVRGGGAPGRGRARC